MPKRRSGLRDDNIRDLLEDLELDEIGGDDLELPDWDFGDEDDDDVEVQEEITYINGLETVRYVRPVTPNSDSDDDLIPATPPAAGCTGTAGHVASHAAGRASGRASDHGASHAAGRASGHVAGQAAGHASGDAAGNASGTEDINGEEMTPSSTNR